MVGNLTYLDILMIVGYLCFSFFISLIFSKKASQNITSYFVCNRSLPWWLLGTSMVATTFSADTPLAVTGIIAKKGIAGNWYWWVWGIGFLFTAFFIAPLWRRSLVMTDAEIIELRYSGKSAAVLRGFRAIYFGLIANAIMMGWVMRAMTKILKLSFSVSTEHEFYIIWGLFFITVTYTFLSGLWGVVATDFIQFIFAMSGSILLAILAVHHLGGMSKIIHSLNSMYGKEHTEKILDIIPKPGKTLEPFSAFLIYFFIQWWSSGNTDGGGSISQRFLAAKDETHARLASIWFVVAHICLRSWPWIIAGLCALVMYPNLSDPELGYPKLMLGILPAGLRGLMIASFFAAFMSTIDTGLNWGASLLTNDIYKRFISPNRNSSHYMIVAKISVIIIALAGIIATIYTTSIYNAWKYMSNLTVGIGAIYLLRWFWWRVNAWSEISAMIGSLVITNVIYISKEFIKNPDITFYLNYPYSLLWTLIIVLPISILVTLKTKPVEETRLINFVEKVKPPIHGWKEIYEKVKNPEKIGKTKIAGKDILWYVMSVILVYIILIFVGWFFIGHI